MLLPDIMWPLEANTIRKHSAANAFGMVRNDGKRPHQGWDLLAYPGTPVYAISDGTIRIPAPSGDYGRMVMLEFEHRGRTYWATYCHLSAILVGSDREISIGDLIGHSGNTGNAASMKGNDQHLHFEIRTVRNAGNGLGGRVDPKAIYGFVPLNTTVYDTRTAQHMARFMSGPGLKVQGFNVL